MSEPNISSQQVAAVILNYNSEHDVMISAPQLASQKDVNGRLIIVDNASLPESVERIKGWLVDWKPNAIIGTKSEVDVWICNNPEKARASGQVYFILNHENRGYSAGNNIGIRLAETLGVDAVLIANPDMYIDNPRYTAELVRILFSNHRHCIAASRILGLDGIDQNPLREATFLEELFWPRIFLFKFFAKHSYVIPIESEEPVNVPKVSGCCFLIRMTFIQDINYLDENVFLYCEEPILSALIRRKGGSIIFSPTLIAIHAHDKTNKTALEKRMKSFITSRIYYLENYSDYSLLKLILLKATYSLMFILNLLRTIYSYIQKHNEAN